MELEKGWIITLICNSDCGLLSEVVIPKVDGCIDYKVGVNERLVNALYPIRIIYQIFNSLKDMQYFHSLPLCKTYAFKLRKFHLKFKWLQRIEAHFGRVASAKFNRVIDPILCEITKIEENFDYIVIHGESLAECKANLKSGLTQLKKCDLHFYLSKYAFYQKRIEILGDTVGYNKVRKPVSKVEIIIEIPQPNCTNYAWHGYVLVQVYTKRVHTNYIAPSIIT